MMRSILTSVAGVLSISCAISSATAGQPVMGRAVEPVLFVAPEPTPADAASEPAVADEAYDSALAEESYDPAIADTVSDSTLRPLPGSIAEGDMGFAYAGDGEWAECCETGAPYGNCPRRARCVGSTCTMGQHHAYFPSMHGYYYFRPYHHSHVWKHQMLGQLWGEDPANPYGNRIFEAVYEQYLADEVPEPAVIED